MIQLKNINFCYAGGENAGRLEQINLEIPDGQVVLLCGRSGCGKTTLTRLVNGLIPNYYEGELTGEVLLDGKNISRLPLYETAKYVGSVFQNPRTQFFTVDSTSELAFGCENQGLPESEIIHRVKSTAAQFDMEDLLGKNIFRLSGGEKQKIACASVSVSNPPVIVLDEPSSNLDQSATEDLRRMIRICASNKMSLRMTWQDEDVPITTDQASRLCRRITTAGAGKVQKDVPDGDECQLVFGDGASLTMWQVDIPEKNAANPTGTFIRYADADGRIYQYDTDQLLFTEIAAILALP